MKTKLKRFVAVMLSFVMIVLSPSSNGFAEDTPPAVTTNGIIGIVNTFYAETLNTCEYKIELLDHNGDVINTTVPEIVFTGTDNNNESGYVYLNYNGTFEVPKGYTVNFSKEDEFLQMLKEKNAYKLRIRLLEYDQINNKEVNVYSVTEDGGDNQTIQTLTEEYQQDDVTKTRNYSAVEYNLYTVYEYEEDVTDTDENGDPILDENGDPVTHKETRYEDHHFSDHPDEFDFKPATFTSSEMMNVDVTVLWHDRGVDRPTSEQITFDLQYGENQYYYQDGMPETNAPTHTFVNSNKDLYTFNAPKFDPNGNPITYTAQMNDLPDNLTVPYRDVESGDNTFVMYSQRTFECDMDWREGSSEAHLKQFCVDENGDFDTDCYNAVKAYLADENAEYPPTDPLVKSFVEQYTKNVEKFISENFTLMDQNAGKTTVTINGADTETDTDVAIDWKDNENNILHKIDYNPKTGHITVHGLDEITNDGKAKSYYLTYDPTQDISAIDNDTWTPKIENPGVRIC